MRPSLALLGLPDRQADPLSPGLPVSPGPEEQRLGDTCPEVSSEHSTSGIKVNCSRLVALDNDEPSFAADLLALDRLSPRCLICHQRLLT